MAGKIATLIQENRFLTTINKAVATMGVVNHFLVLLCIALFLITKIDATWTVYAIKLLPYLTLLYASFLTFSFANQLVTSAQKAVLFAVASLMVHITTTGTSSILLLAPLTVYLIRFFYIIGQKMNVNIKGAPPAVNQTLTSLVPILTSFLGAALLTFLYREGNSLIFRLFDEVMKAASSIYGITLIVLFVCAMWSKGYHGANLIGSLMRIVFTQMMLNNIVIFLSGVDSSSYLISEPFFQWCVWIGGSGTTLGLTFALRFFAKSKELKQIGKEALVPGIFNINESIIFGVPIVESKRYLFPFFVAPLVCAWISYWVMMQGYVSIPILPVTWIAPNPIGLFVSTLFDWRALVLAVGLIIVSMLIYLPFMIKNDRDNIEHEQGMLH